MNQFGKIGFWFEYIYLLHFVHLRKFSQKTKLVFLSMLYL